VDIICGCHGLIKVMFTGKVISALWLQFRLWTCGDQETTVHEPRLPHGNGHFWQPFSDGF